MLYEREPNVRYVLICICLLVPVQISAQEINRSATLMGWEQRVKNFMLDRSGNFGGTHFNRGLFRMHIKTMSPEHEIDLLTYQFSLIEDYQFEQAENAYRVSMGSLNATSFAVENKMKSSIRIDHNDELVIEAFQAENLRANRLLFKVNYVHALSDMHYIGLRHTLNSEKADLDASFFYRYGHVLKGMVEFEFTFMDWGSNIVENLATDSYNKWNKRYPVTHQYETAPKLVSLSLISPRLGGIKAELMGGIQSITQKEVTLHEDTTSFMDKEWAHYAGALIEYATPHLNIGITYQRTFSKLRRTPVSGTGYDLDFQNRQITNSIGLYASGEFRSLIMEQWIWFGYHMDELQGERVPDDVSLHGPRRIPFDYAEKPLTLKSSLLYDPGESGFKTGLEFHAEYVHPQGEKAANGVINLNYRSVLPIIRDVNQRLTYTFGYRFTKDFYIILGISYDLDKDKQSGIGAPRVTGTPTWFDGGFGRIMLTW